MLAYVSALLLLSPTVVVAFSTTGRSARSAATSVSMSGKGGANFNYDPSNYKDSNNANYRRLTDQLAAAKAEDEQLKREREEILRKEAMALMFLKKENETFWGTKGNSIVATADKFYVSPEVLQVIADLDNQLIGLEPVRIIADNIYRFLILVNFL